jgi:hypothetical protein
MLTFVPMIEHDESSAGYLLRLAEHNFLSSPSVLLCPARIRLKTAYSPEELQEIAALNGLKDQHFKSDTRSNPPLSALDTGYFVRKSAIPVCPCCLTEKSYIRQAWHHELVTACPTHRSVLIERCPDCDTPLELNRPAVSQCRCGFCLSDIVAAEAHPADLFVAETLTKNDSELKRMWGGPLPDNTDQFLFFLANLTLSPPHRKNAAINFERAEQINRASYSIAVDLHPNFRTFVRNKVAFANGLASGRFIKNLGSWYKRFLSEFPGVEYEQLRDEIHGILVNEANAPINRKMKQIGAAFLAMKSCLTVTEAARSLGSSPERVWALVRQKKLQGTIIKGVSNDFCLVDRSSVETEKVLSLKFVDGKEVVKRLSTTRSVRDRLVTSGVLKRVQEREKPLFAKGDYRIVEVDALVEQLENSLIERRCALTVSLTDISGKRFTCDQAHELFRLIFEGNLAPVCRLPGVPGLSGFQFDLEQLKAAVWVAKEDLSFTITDLTKVSPWKHESIKSWIDAGLLECRRTHTKEKEKISISLANLIDFLSRYAVAADAAARLNSKSIWITNVLKTKDVLVEPTFVSSTGVVRGQLVAIDRLINVASSREPHWMRRSTSPAQGAVRDTIAGGQSHDG